MKSAVKKSGELIQLDTKIFLDGHTKKIKESMKKITSEFMYIAFLLWEVREFKYYEVDGYKSVTAYAETELCMDSGTVSKMIKLCENFSSRTHAGCPSFNLAEKYQGFGSSQLIEILKLPLENREEIVPQMTVKQIREVNKKLKEKTATSQVLEKEELKSENLNELKCDNCGKSYLADKDKRLLWIEIGGKHVAPCCYKTIWDSELLMKKQGK